MRFCIMVSFYLSIGRDDYVERYTMQLKRYAANIRRQDLNQLVVFPRAKTVIRESCMIINSDGHSSLALSRRLMR